MIDGPSFPPPVPQPGAPSPHAAAKPRRIGKRDLAFTLAGALAATLVFVVVSVATSDDGRTNATPTTTVPQVAQVPETSTDHPTTIPSETASSVESPTASTAATSGDVTPLPVDTALFFGTANPSFDAGEPGKLSIVQIGQPVGSFLAMVPIVVRNMTAGTLTGIEVSGGARSGGQLVASGSSLGFHPSSVPPGGVAFGFVFFGSELPADVSLELTVAGSPPDQYLSEVDVLVSEANLVADDYGSHVAGTVTNASDTTVSGPFSVGVYCFDGDLLISADTGYTDGSNELAPGASVTFSVALFDRECPTFLVAASGYNF